MSDIQMPYVSRDGETRTRDTPKIPFWKRFWTSDANTLMDSSTLSMRVASEAVNPDAPRRIEDFQTQVMQVVWGQRRLQGRLLTDKQYRRAMWYQNVLLLVALPPVGLFMLIWNGVLGLHPRATRICFIATAAFWLVIVTQADKQHARLLEIADKCPVHKTLEAGAKVETSLA